MNWLVAARRCLAQCATPLARRLARACIARDLERSARVAERWTRLGMGVTLGFWDAPADRPRRVADEYLAQIMVLSTIEHSYLSIKLPGIDFSEALFFEIVDYAARHRVRVHVDSLECEIAHKTRTLIDRALERGATISYTIPGRWVRSVDDAAWATERGITVRVVKGHWPDPDHPEIDASEGYLRVIDELAGKARHVAVATHDPLLAAEAVRRLRAAGTTCHLELLRGLPMRPSLELADRMALGVFVYVPYGQAYLPYALSTGTTEPRVVWWLVRELLSSWRPYRVATDRRRHRVSDELHSSGARTS